MTRSQSTAPAAEPSARRFSQQLDRAAFTAYFLGAIVPLAALGFVVEHFALPRLSDRLDVAGLLGAVVSVALLSLGAFLVLRATMRRSLQRIEADNQRLTGLLRASGELASAEHGALAAGAAARAALELTRCRAAFVVVRGAPGAPPVLLESAGVGADKLFDRLCEPLSELANLVMSEGRPGVQGAGGEAELGAAAGVPLPGEAATSGALIAVRQAPAEGFTMEELDTLTTLGGLVAVALRNSELQDTQRNFFTHVTEILAQALDSHLDYHSGHGHRVAQYANRIGRKLGLDDHRLQRLHFAALLHDIGMLKLERGQLDSRRACARHCELGFRMLDRIKLWKEVAPIVHHHHECWNGSGYPEGLSAEAIPLEARIIALADAFDAITSRTSYKPPISMEEALHEIEAHAGSQFDPRVVSAFAELVRDGELDVAE